MTQKTFENHYIVRRYSILPYAFGILSTLIIFPLEGFAADPMTPDSQMGMRFGNFLGSLFQQMQGSGNYSMELPNSQATPQQQPYFPPRDSFSSGDSRRSNSQAIEDRQLEERLQAYLRNLPGLRYDPWGATYWNSNPLIDSDPLYGRGGLAPRYNNTPRYAPEYAAPEYGSRPNLNYGEYGSPYSRYSEPNRDYYNLDNREWNGNYQGAERRDSWSSRRPVDPYVDRYGYPSYPNRSEYAPSWGW